MSDAAAPAPAKSPKKKAAAKPKKPASHPTYSEMIAKAIAALKERKGSSRQAILKYIQSNYKVGDNDKAINAHLKMALRNGVKNKTLTQSKGTGASGSFKIGEKTTKKAAKKPAAKKAKKPKAATPKKAKKPKAKKPAGEKKAAAKPKAKKPKAKKPAAKKAAKPKKAAKSPKKKAAAKPKAKKTPKKK